MDTAPARTWELDEADSWEPIVPETWAAPADIAPAPAGETTDTVRRDTSADDTTHQTAPGGDGGGERTEPAGEANAGWSDAARSEEEWADAAHSGGWDSSSWPGIVPDVEAIEPEVSPGRLALITSVGLAQETASGLFTLSRRLLRPAARVAVGAVRTAAVLPVTGAPVRAVLRSGRRAAQVVTTARERGRQTVQTGQHELVALLRRGVQEVVDQVVPRLASELEARLIGQPAPDAQPTPDPAANQARPDQTRPDQARPDQTKPHGMKATAATGRR